MENLFILVFWGALLAYGMYRAIKHPDVHAPPEDHGYRPLPAWVRLFWYTVALALLIGLVWSLSEPHPH